MQRVFRAAFVGAALIVPLTLAPGSLRADEHDADRTYHDREHNDDHRWNQDEDRAYRSWAQENHRKYKDFSRLNEHDQQRYWTWRHEHPDAHEHTDQH